MVGESLQFQLYETTKVPFEFTHPRRAYIIKRFSDTQDKKRTRDEKENFFKNSSVDAAISVNMCKKSPNA